MTEPDPSTESGGWAAPDVLQVDYRKWPEALHWSFEAERLGRDEFGHWFAIRAGASVKKGDEPALAHPAVTAMLARDGVWSCPYWNSDPDGPFDVYVDIVAPARAIGRRITMVDLDLDVVRTRDGAASVIDEDEFLAHQKRYAYPPWLIEGAQREADRVLALVASRIEPFGRVGEQWLERGRELERR